MNGYIVLGSAGVGLLVGLTGAGGGALMTPMLIMLFSVKPEAAISSDLVATLVMRPVGAAVHLKRGTPDLRLAGWMSVGSVPAALGGAYLLHLIGHTGSATVSIERLLGAVLLVGATGMILRRVLDCRSGVKRELGPGELRVRRWPTALVGVAGGLLVGSTSVGSGSLMVVLLMFTYPGLSARRLVGTDLVQAIPLTGAAALGALLFGQVQVGLTIWMVIGAVPAVVIGSVLSSRVNDRALRPIMLLLIIASGCRYLGASPHELAYSIAILVAGYLGMVAVVRSRRSGRGAAEELVSNAVAPVVLVGGSRTT